MSGFDFEWLDLREPADTAARDPRLLARAANAASRRPHLPVVDLGCGTGSTARAMASRLPAETAWRLVDHDARLLDIAAERIGAGAETVAADLSDLSALPLEGAGLVTGSALFDLVSADWTKGFARRLAAAGAPLYAALTYDGRTDWSPKHPSDGAVLAAFNRHQTSDKGFGPALGPAAAACLAAALEAEGYSVETSPSDWHLGPDSVPLAEELARGIAAAAVEAGIDGATAAEWLNYRIETAPAGMVMVGHVDLFAEPPVEAPSP